MDKSKFLERLNELIEEGRLLADDCEPAATIDPLRLDVNQYIKYKSWRFSSLNLLRSFFGAEHPFFKSFLNCQSHWSKVLSKDVSQWIEYCQESVAGAYAILKSIKKEVDLGLIADARHLYEADLFSNLLEQAFELAEKNYLVGATVYCRLIIENFINDLCRIKEIELEGKEKLSSKLTKLRKKDVIDLPTERLIQANYDIGSYAVHGDENFKKYNKENIIDLLNMTRDKILTIK